MSDRPLSPEERKIRDFLLASRGDHTKYIQKCLKVVNKQSELVPFRMNATQRLIHEKLEWQLREFGLVRAMILKGRKMGSCLTPDTRVLMGDLTWSPVGGVRPGDRVLAVDEEHGEHAVTGRTTERRVRFADVEAVARLRDEVFEIVLSNGTVLKATANHRWLCRQRGGCYVNWRHVRDMRVGDHVRAATHRPDDDLPTHEDGWAGGLLDGDGSCSDVTRTPRLVLTQVQNAVLDRYTTYLDDLGIHYYHLADNRPAAPGKKFKGTEIHTIRVDRYVDIIRILGRAKPVKFDVEGVLSGRKLPKTADDFEAWPKVVSITSLGVQDVVDLQTSERTFIAEGIVSHNSTYVGGRFYTKTHLWAHRRAVVMAHVRDSARDLFSMVQRYHEHNPLALTADRSNAGQLQFSNGSSYTVATAGSGEAGRGGTPTLAHLSEAAFYPNPEKTFAGFANSVPMAANTEIIVESTANGMGNEFHSRWVRAEAALDDDMAGIAYLPIFVPWFMDVDYRLEPPAGFRLSGEAEGDGLPSERDIAEMFGLDNSQMAWRRFYLHEQLNGSVETFMQEYPNTAAEAFQSTGLQLFIKPIYVLQARKRQDVQAFGPRILGVDPAGQGGDKFCMTLRQGCVVHWQEGRAGIEPGEAQGMWVADVMDRERVDRCNVDHSGGWGDALLAWLRENRPDLYDKTYRVDFGGKSQAKTVNPHKPGPRNRRAEMYMRGRDWLMLPEGVSVPDDDLLQNDLSVMQENSTGQITDTQLESKKDIKKRLKRSPDYSDSWALTFAFPDRVVQTTLTPTVESDSVRFAKGDAVRSSTPDVGYRGGTGFDSGGGWMT